jgi:hypothetical protein
MSQFYDTIDGMNFQYPDSTSMAFFLQCDFYLLGLLPVFSVTSASYVLEMPVSMVNQTTAGQRRYRKLKLILRKIRDIFVVRIK